MKYLIPLLALSLLACNGEPIEGAAEAAALCGEFCSVCGQENPDCANICLDQWHVFGSYTDKDRQECAAGYLLARECQYNNAPECDATECGDPYNDMLRCVALIGEGEDKLPIEGAEGTGQDKIPVRDRHEGGRW